MIANWDNVEGFWDGFSTFAVGAGAAGLAFSSGGAGIGAAIASGTAGGIVVGANNSIVEQTGKNFSGIGQVDWGQVGSSAVIGGAAGAAGAAAGYGVSSMSFAVNGIKSPLLRSAVVSPLSAGAGHVAGGTMANLATGQSLNDAFNNSFKGIGKSMAINGAIGVATTTAVLLSQGISPITGENFRTTNNTTKTEYTYTKSAEKHLTEVVKHGKNAGEFVRPYMKSPLTIQEIMSTGKGVPDATFKGV